MNQDEGRFSTSEVKNIVRWVFKHGVDWASKYTDGRIPTKEETEQKVQSEIFKVLADKFMDELR